LENRVKCYPLGADAFTPTQYRLSKNNRNNIIYGNRTNCHTETGPE
jgi:hypothetical protein